MKILIAEDDPASCEALRATLERWEHEVTVCRDGAEAWEALQRQDAPKLAILDWMMPEMDGLEVCRKVREMPHSEGMYILLLTSRTLREELVECLQAGADDYVAKPFDREELRARMQVGMRVIGLQERLLEAERMRVLAETAGAAAHEINQPLTVVIGKTDIVLEKMASEDPQRHNIEDIQEAGERISEIVRKMGAARQYVTKPYIGKYNIVDFDESAREKGGDEKEGE